jgi:hypothetical protein
LKRGKSFVGFVAFVYFRRMFESGFDLSFFGNVKFICPLNEAVKRA